MSGWGRRTCGLGLALLVIVGLSAGCTGASGKAQAPVDPARVAQLEALVKAEFPPAHGALIRRFGDATLGPDVSMDELDEIRTAIDPNTSVIKGAPDPALLEFIAGYRDLTDPSRNGLGSCREGGRAWRVEALLLLMRPAAIGLDTAIRRDGVTPQDIEALYAQAASSVERRELEDHFVNGESLPRNRGEQCRILHAWFSALSQLPPDVAIRLQYEQYGAGKVWDAWPGKIGVPEFMRPLTP